MLPHCKNPGNTIPGFWEPGRMWKRWISMNADQKFARQMAVISLTFAAVMALGGLAISLLLEQKSQ